MWLLLQVHFHELHIQRPSANCSSISWFLVAFYKAKITWSAVNKKHSTNCWDTVRLEKPHVFVYQRTTLLGLPAENRGVTVQRDRLHSMALSSFCPFPYFRLIIIEKEALPPTLVTVEEIFENQNIFGLSHSFLFQYSAGTWTLIHELVPIRFLFKRLFSSGTTDRPNARSTEVATEMNREDWGKRKGMEN